MGLRHLFSGSKPAGDVPRSFQSRVFLVTDNGLRHEILDLMMRHDKKGFNALLGLSCPGMLKNRMPGLFTGHNIAEAILLKDEMYITVPSASYMEQEYDEPDLTAELKAWRPLLALREVDPAILGVRTIGFPRLHYTPPVIRQARPREP